ncbi:MAG: capsule biosynthesis protein [Alphaproteobacteria bacterium]|nr:capsule biosynthesis protein [Alphaproteobacteria bacterium]
MIMKPKAKKFRIRRSATPSGVSGPTRPQTATHEAAPSETVIEHRGHAHPPDRGPSLRPPGDGLSPDETSFLSPREEIEKIKQEGLTGRQLRMARREAQKHGLSASSDLDAVRLLRKSGVDPFKRSDLLELVVTDQGETSQNLPAAIRHAPPPSPHILDPNERAREVQNIQRDLAKRRRRRLTLLMIKLGFFVFIPTFLAGYYYYRIATPMYATYSEFVIQKAQSSALGAAAAGLFSGTSLATSQDSITVQSYLNSREAMQRLNKEQGFKAHFQQAFIDPIQRLDPNGTNEAAYRIYKKRVKIGYDPTEGIIKMEVVAATPKASAEFSKALISYAEEQVDQLTKRLRSDQMKGARESYKEAETKLTEANQRVLSLQEKAGVVSAESELALQMRQISTFELELKNKQLQLAELLDNPRPNRTKVNIAKKTIVRLENLVRDMRDALTIGKKGSSSIAKVQGELVIAQADVATRQLMLSQSLQQLETARVEANRQTRYLSLGVRPIAPDEATYPRAFQNTILAFLVFGGLYLMASLTASILREQISA